MGIFPNKFCLSGNVTQKYEQACSILCVKIQPPNILHSKLSFHSYKSKQSLYCNGFWSYNPHQSSEVSQQFAELFPWALLVLFCYSSTHCPGVWSKLQIWQKAKELTEHTLKTLIANILYQFFFYTILLLLRKILTLKIIMWFTTLCLPTSQHKCGTMKKYLFHMFFFNFTHTKSLFSSVIVSSL